jgi:hypothetical protein
MPSKILTIVAATGERFSDFSPYVASVNDAGTVAFQAALTAGGSGVFKGEGSDVEEVAGPDLLDAVTSHPDLSNEGATSFYGDVSGGGQGAFLLLDGHLLTIADTAGSFAAIGPLGPTMDEEGAVAFRADPAEGTSGIFSGDGDTITTVADTEDRWSEFHGLPVITSDRAVVFRADRKDGVEGIYVGRAGSVETVVETGDVFETLARFPSASDRGTVAFAATLRTGGAGVFTVEGGKVTRVADTDSPFESFRGALITNAGSVVLVATPRGGGLGLFTGPSSEQNRILAVGDPLLGSAVEELAANPVSVNVHGQVAIRARLVDGRQLILRADPPG